MMRIENSITLSAGSDQQIRGVYRGDESHPSAPIVIFAHGLGSHRSGEKASALQAECAQRGWAFAAFDFHGHGASDGTMLDLRGARLIADLNAITQFATERGHKSIFLVGSSMGGWAAAWFAASNPQRVRACALLAPAFRFLDWRRLTPVELQRWQQQGRLRITNEWIDLELDYELHAEAEQYSFERLCAALTVPCLLMHGMQDDTVPYSTSIEFTEQCVAPDLQLLLLKNGDHRLHMHKDWLACTACDFFAARL